MRAKIVYFCIMLNQKTTKMNLISNKLLEFLTHCEHSQTFIDAANKSEEKKYFCIAMADQSKISFVPLNRIERFEGDFYNEELRRKYAVMAKPGKLIKELSGCSDKIAEDFSKPFIAFNSNKTLKVSSDFKLAYKGENYFSEDGTLGGSCMKHDRCMSYLSIYKENGVKVLILLRDGKVHGRALLWSKENVSIVFNNESLNNCSGFMDRIYTHDENDTVIFINWADSNNFCYKKNQNYTDKCSFVYAGEIYNSYAKVSKINTDFEEYPYVDTFTYGDDGYLTNENNEQYSYDNTDGTRDGCSCMCYNCGCRISNGEQYTVDGDNYCSECYHDTFYTCERCSESVRMDDSDVVCAGDNVYCCESCANRDGYYQCDECGEWFNGDNMINDYCENCYCETHSRCNKCEDDYLTEEMHLIDGEYYCNDCCHECEHCSEMVVDGEECKCTENEEEEETN